MHVDAAGPWAEDQDVPQHVEVLVNPTCPHCIHALDEVTDLAVREGIAIAGVDLVHHPEAARGYEHSPIVRCGDEMLLDLPSPEAFHQLVERARRG